MENEKVIKNPIIKKRINLISLDKHQLNHQTNIYKKDNNNFDEIIINIKNNNEKNKNKETNNEYEQRKIRLKLPVEILRKNKGIDYIILNKNKKGNINIENKNSGTTFLNNIYKENYENKKKLEELINDYSLKKKITDNDNDNTSYDINNKYFHQKQNNNEMKNDIYFTNSINRETNKEENENNQNLVLKLKNGNYCKKRPYYALDNRIYYKNKNVEKNTPFKHKIVNTETSFPKKVKYSNNSQNTAELLEKIKNRNSLKVNPINLTYNNVGDLNIKNEYNILNNSKRKFYSRLGRNNIFNIKRDLTDISNDNYDIKSNSSYSKVEYNSNKLYENINSYNENKEDIMNKFNPLFRRIENRQINKNNNNNNNEDTLSSYSKNLNIGLNRKHRSFNKHSFKFLVQQTNKSRELSLSFNKRYKSKNTTLNNNETNNDSLSFSNIYNETDINIDQESNKHSMMYYNSIISDKKCNSENEKKNNKFYSLKPFKTVSELIKKNKMENNGNKCYYNKIISDDYIEYRPISATNRKESLNRKKESINKDLLIKSKELNIPKKKESHMEMPPDYKIFDSKASINHSSTSLNNELNSINNLNKENNINSPASLSSINTNFYSFINLELLYFFEEKMKIIIEKIKNYEECSKECHQYINYYFVHNFYIEELRVFKINENREFMINYLKIEILCYFLLYNISLGDKFKEAKILLISIFELLYNNFLLFISLIITQIENKDNNLINELNKIIKENLNIDLLKDVTFNFYNLDENKFIDILLSNSKKINDYYKMITNNFYMNYSNKNNYIKFPECININTRELDKTKLDAIISSFFIESYKSLPSFYFETFKKFYYSFLCFNENEEKNENIFEENLKKSHIEEEKDKKYLLPEIKGKKYSLILDLDETIIYSQRNFNYKIRKSENRINKKKIILRPGLYEFLHEMKALFELIVFSSGTPDYVDPIIKIIEKNEKYFDHILYRHHITLDENGYNVKNLDLIGRDLSKVIIVDDIPRYFSLHKENGINIKPFCGNILSDTKTLKTLNVVLKQIRVDAEETNDIRISLQKYKHLLYPNVINNIE